MAKATGKAGKKPQATKAGTKKSKAPAFVRKASTDYETGPREGSLADFAARTMKRIGGRKGVRFSQFLEAFRNDAKPYYKAKKEKMPEASSFDRVAWVALARVGKRTGERGVWKL